MEENGRKSRTTLVIVTGIITLLLGLCLGAVFGGVGGYFLGRQAAPALRPAQVATPRAAVPTPHGIAPTPTPRRSIVPPILTPMPGPELPNIPRIMAQGGAYVQEVVKNTPADAAGMKQGDIVTKVNNTPVDATHRLGDVLAQLKPGDSITLTLTRAGREMTLTVKLGQHPDDAKRAYLGIRYADMVMPQPTPGQ